MSCGATTARALRGCDMAEGECTKLKDVVGLMRDLLVASENDLALELLNSLETEAPSAEVAGLSRQTWLRRKADIVSKTDEWFVDSATKGRSKDSNLRTFQAANLKFQQEIAEYTAKAVTSCDLPVRSAPATFFQDAWLAGPTTRQITPPTTPKNQEGPARRVRPSSAVRQITSSTQGVVSRGRPDCLPALPSGKPAGGDFFGASSQQDVPLAAPQKRVVRKERNVSHGRVAGEGKVAAAA
eukprot:TRINITY_DN67066_c0_g1_i1.p1 TRINITY_DN67066_c0_g1~~TRINITY_DN67066_c0_g1_i1.p1  ORF type:complete len:241 (-),score=31.02 TRINITY_DN67066_c0_g1_i1:8-730(-)